MMRRGYLAACSAAAIGLVMVASTASSVAEPTKESNANVPNYVPDEPLPEEAVHPQEALDEWGISGYPDRMNVHPGESVSIMVSTKAKTFDADMVRISHGDPDPQGPGVKEEVIKSPVNRTYKGRHQPLPLGSYGTVPRSPKVQPRGSFSITAFVAPTTIPGSKYNRTALQRTPVGEPRPQGLITNWSEQGERGYGLFVDDQGAIALRLGDGARTETVSTGVKLRPWAPALGGPEMHFNKNPRPMHVNHSGWYFVAASYDARTKRVTVTQDPVAKVPDNTAKTITKRVKTRGVAHSRSPLLMGAYTNKPGEKHPTGFFNGKIESPRFYDRALSRADLKAAARGRDLSATAAWDFSQKMSTDHMVDTGPNSLDGKFVNTPVRALTSHDWDRETMNYNQKPEQWGSAYFHEDDLSDANWRPSFTWKVPKGARSGIYAARLRAGEDTYHATFVVTPRRAENKTAMLVPTFSYLAYGKTGNSLSQYSDHADGSGYVYSSAKRPIEDLRPYYTGKEGEGRPWQFEADTHIFDWLETKKYDVDYITDHDLHKHGRKLLDGYDTVLTGSHPEYISGAQMDALHGWLKNGGRLMYMGGNGFYWVTSLDRSGTYTELRRHDGTEAWQAAPGEYYHATTGEYGGLWRFRGRPPQELLGVGFTAQGFGNKNGSAEYNKPFDRTEESYSPKASWIFEGVDNEEGIGGDMPTLQSPGGPMGEEVDRADYALGTPANAIIVGVSQQFGDEYMHVVEEINTSSLFEGGTTNPMVRGDVTLMHYPQGGAVFSTSSMVWSGGFYHNNYDNDMTRITENVLNAFISDKPLPGTR